MLRIALQRRYCAVPCFLGQPVFTSQEFCILGPFLIFCVFCICVSVFSQALQRRRGAVQCFLGQPVFTNPGFQWRWNPCVLVAFQSN